MEAQPQDAQRKPDRAQPQDSFNFKIAPTINRVVSVLYFTFIGQPPALPHFFLVFFR